MTTLTPINLRSFEPVEENIEPPETLSQTRLKRYDNCPRAFYLDAMTGGGKGSIALDRGIALHDTLEKAQKLMIDQQEPIMPGEVARELAEGVMQDRLDLVLPAAEQDRVRGMAWNFAESPQGRINFDTILGVEIPMEMELQGWRITCRVDRAEAVGNTLHVYDWKSGFPGKQEDTDQSFQGQFYATALLFGHLQDDDPAKQHTFGAGITDVFFYETFPRIRDEETGSLFVRETSWTRSEIAEFKASLERNILAVENSLLTGDWPARDGSWCSFCPAQSLCPIPKEHRALLEIESYEDAQDALAWLGAYDRLKKPYQDGLRGYVKENGKVVRGDEAFDASVQESRSTDWDAVNSGASAKEAVKVRTSTRYAKRKLTKEEREDA